MQIVTKRVQFTVFNIRQNRLKVKIGNKKQRKSLYNDKVVNLSKDITIININALNIAVPK